MARHCGCSFPPALQLLVTQCRTLPHAGVRGCSFPPALQLLALNTVVHCPGLLALQLLATHCRTLLHAAVQGCSFTLALQLLALNTVVHCPGLLALQLLATHCRTLLHAAVQGCSFTLALQLLALNTVVHCPGLLALQLLAEVQEVHHARRVAHRNDVRVLACAPEAKRKRTRLLVTHSLAFPRCLMGRLSYPSRRMSSRAGPRANTQQGWEHVRTQLDPAAVQVFQMFGRCMTVNWLPSWRPSAHPPHLPPQRFDLRTG